MGETMPTISFTAYDFFGYLASGFLFMIAVIFVGTKQWLFTSEYNFLSSIFLIIIAYIVGHLIAIPAKLVYERRIVGKWLKSPQVNLFNSGGKTGLKKYLSEYYEPFPESISERIKKKAKHSLQQIRKRMA
jgi:hypothetical protein